MVVADRRSAPARTPRRDAPPAAGERDRTRGRAIGLHLAVVSGLLLASVGLWWHVWATGNPTSTVTCQCGDPSQELWFLSWTPWAILHGHDPFFTTAVFSGRGGENLLVNTGVALPALLLAPVTWLFGPIAAFNVGATLAPVVSGWSFFFASRTFSRFVPAQALGTLLYAFSPTVLWNDPFGHLNLTLLYFPPLATVLVHDLLVTRRRPPARNGALLGLLVVAQFFTGTEILALSTIVGTVVLVLAALANRRAAWAMRRDLVVGFGTAALVAACVLAYPLWFVADGPRHIVGAAWKGSATFGAPPGAIGRVGSSPHAGSLGNVVGGYFGGVGPNFSAWRAPDFDYLGWPLLALLGLSAVVWARSRLAWAMVAAGVVAWLCSFGTMLGTEFDPLSRQVHPGWLPWHFLGSLPLVTSSFPVRFGALVTLAAAGLLVLSLDGWMRRLGPAPSGTGTSGAAAGRRHLLVGLGLTVAGAATLVPLASSAAVPFSMHSSALPPWFSVEAPRLAPSTVALVLPFEGQTAMGWQAEAGMPFALANGFGIVPGASGVPNGGASAAASILGALSPPVGTPSAPTGRPTPTQLGVVGAAIVRWGVDVVVVPSTVTGAVRGVAFFTALLHGPPRHEDGASVWDDVGAALRPRR